ncbi:MAG: NAD(P)/FAD-dependent oxidoreductase [Kofleriaceae bacterium]
MAEIRERRAARRGISRRGFLTGAAAGAAILAIPRGVRAATGRKITIVGGGIAGLNCALELRDAGFASTVYEAAGRIGGRMFTNRTNYFGGQITEWGGELIDSGHKTIKKLATRYHLPLDNLLGAQPNGSRDTYKFSGQYYAATAADADFLEIADIVATDLEEAGYPTTWDSNTPEGRALDQMSVHDWINSRVPGGHSSPLGKLLDVAYAIEYGADARAQSSLNLLYLLGFQPTANKLDVFGESDEKFHLRGGNQQLPEAIAADLGSAVQTGYRLVRLEQTANGRYRSTFERAGSTVEDVADFVVLALPFAVLRDIDTSNAGFDARKRRAIDQLGNGHNGKLQLQFANRGWLGQGPWPGKANGSSYSDTGYQASWEATRAQPGTAGILVLYSGGSGTDAMHAGSPFSTASDPNVQYDAQRGSAQLAPVFPSLGWNGRATQSLPHKSPFFNASYSFYKVGQYTDFGGYEGTKQGGVYFCGEHTSQDFQGFMEGGAITGSSVATKLAKRLG